MLLITFYPGGAIWDELQKEGSVGLGTLNKSGRWDLVTSVLRLATLLRRWRADVLHTYLVEPSIYGLTAGRLAGVSAVVWGVRASNMDHSKYDAVTGWTFIAAGWLSRFADLTIANSEAGRAYHVAHHYPEPRIVVIPNGIDTNRFRPAADARAAVRNAWRVDDGEVVVGVSARLDPMKDHTTLIRAAEIVRRANPRARFVCYGSGPADYLRSLQTLAATLDVTNRIIWVGEHGDMQDVYPGFDLVCSSSSFGEGFSNAIGEAMSCGIPCVATDVGDARAIIGDTGIVVAPKDPTALADAILQLSKLTGRERTLLGDRARARIIERYALASMVNRTAAVYEDLVGWVTG